MRIFGPNVFAVIYLVVLRGWRNFIVITKIIIPSCFVRLFIVIIIIASLLRGGVFLKSFGPGEAGTRGWSSLLGCSGFDGCLEGFCISVIIIGLSDFDLSLSLFY